MECRHLVISRNPYGRGLENIFRAIAIRTNQPKIEMVSDCSVHWGLVGTGNNMGQCPPIPDRSDVVKWTYNLNGHFHELIFSVEIPHHNLEYNITGRSPVHKHDKKIHTVADLGGERRTPPQSNFFFILCSLQPKLC